MIVERAATFAGQHDGNSRWSCWLYVASSAKYAKIIPAVEKLKIHKTVALISVVLHENEIRKQKGEFAFLSHLPTRNAFMAQLSSIMDASNFILIAGVVDKVRLGRHEDGGIQPVYIAGPLTGGTARIPG